MGDLDPTCVQWSKSSYSSANDACVEVAQNPSGVVANLYETPRIRRPEADHLTRRTAHLRQRPKELTVPPVDRRSGYYVYLLLCTRDHPVAIR
jgi:hypothetical protein